MMVLDPVITLGFTGVSTGLRFFYSFAMRNQTIRVSIVCRLAQPIVGILLIRCILPGAVPPTSAKPAPDELIFVDGERLLGHFERSDKDTVTFKSDMAGQIKAPWSNIKELHSGNRFAVIPKGFRFGRQHEDVSHIPQGNIAVTDQKVAISDGTASGAAFPVSDTDYVIDDKQFTQSLKRPAVFADWKGSVTAGVALVLATEDSRTYTSAISLTRAIPTEPWMKPENRTMLDFSSSYGELTQPGEPLTKTSIFHADAERDEYFTPELYSFAEAAFDHNFSQGLDLQDTVGGGLGWTATRSAGQELDLKAEATYVNQEFFLSSQNQKLFGSVFSEGWKYKFKRGILFQEALSFSPAWTDTNAYSANASASFTIPVAKHLNISLNSIDTFLNDPSPGFRKNSFQLSTGLTYTMQ